MYFVDVSIFLNKIILFGKNGTFTRINSVRAVLEQGRYIRRTDFS